MAAELQVNALYRVLGTPPVFMVLVWLLDSAIYAASPIEYFRVPTAMTWGVIAGGIGLYSLSSMLIIAVPPRPVRNADRITIDRVILFTGLIGLGGILFLTVDKVFLSGLDYSQGLTAIKYLRDEQVSQGIEINRSPLLYIGYVTFSAAYVATALFLLKAESVGRWAAIVGQVSVLSPVIYALLYGGRAPILLLCTLIAGTGLVRGMAGLPPLAHARGLRIKSLVLLAAFLAYVNFTWQDRREFSRFGDYENFLSVAEQAWDLQPSPWLDGAVRHGEIDPDLAMDSVSTLLYITHSVGALDKIVEHQQIFSPFLGAFQIGVISPFLRVFFPESDLLERMHLQLVDSDLFGWFVTAWGALYLDFGLWGAVAAVVLWGGLTGHAYRGFARNRDDGSALLLTFWLSSIMVSPWNSPIGMANSVLILAALVVALPFLNRPHGRANRLGMSELNTGQNLLY
jgi:oligosaccharide repeat unit polymerase